MNDKLDEYSLKLLESIFNASQNNALLWAARIRRLVLKEKMKALKAEKHPDPELVSIYLGELEKLVNILGPDTELEVAKA